MEVKETYKPNVHSLKIPNKMISTIYKTEFPKKKQYEVENIPVEMHRRDLIKSQNNSETKLPVQSTYQVIFLFIKELIQKNSNGT